MKNIPSLYFKKEQRQQLHKFIDFALDYNLSCDSWDDYIHIHLYNEDDGTIAEFEQKYDEQGFAWIDAYHEIVPCGREYLSIEHDQTYDIPNDSMIPGYKTVKGEDILNLKGIKDE